jgi:hypothetical protein
MPLAFFMGYFQRALQVFWAKKTTHSGVVSLFLNHHYLSASLYTVAIASKFGPFWPAAMIW